MNLTDCGDALMFSIATMRSIFMVLREMSQQLFDEFQKEFGTNIHVTLRMNCIHFGDPLNFHLAPP